MTHPIATGGVHTRLAGLAVQDNAGHGVLVDDQDDPSTPELIGDSAASVNVHIVNSRFARSGYSVSGRYAATARKASTWCGCGVYVSCRIIEKRGASCPDRKHAIGSRLWLWEILPDARSQHPQTEFELP